MKRFVSLLLSLGLLLSLVPSAWAANSTVQSEISVSALQGIWRGKMGTADAEVSFSRDKIIFANYIIVNGNLDFVYGRGTYTIDGKGITATYTYYENNLVTGSGFSHKSNQCTREFRISNIYNNTMKFELERFMRVSNSGIISKVENELNKYIYPSKNENTEYDFSDNSPPIDDITDNPNNLTESDWYSEGEYRVGIDIPAGEYKFVTTSSTRSGYYCIYHDISKNKIDQNNGFNGNAYCTVTSGQLLRVSKAKFTYIGKGDSNNPGGTNDTDISDNPNNSTESDWYSEGEYRVGIDIPAGEYKFVTTSSTRSGYYCIYHDISKNKIDQNNGFNGNAYCTVTSGQLLRVSRAKFTYIGRGDSNNPGGTNDTDISDNPNTPEIPVETEKKWSGQDALDVSKYLRRGGELISSAGDYVRDASRRGNESIRVVNLKFGIHAAQGAMEYYKAALGLLNSRVELNYTDGSSVRREVQDIYDILDGLSNISTEEEHIEEASFELMNAHMKLLTKQAKVMNAISQLLKEFL